MLICSLLLTMIASDARRLGEPDAPYWIGLAVIFPAIPIDEVAMIHERIFPAIVERLFGIGRMRIFMAHCRHPHRVDCFVGLS